MLAIPLTALCRLKYQMRYEQPMAKSVELGEKTKNKTDNVFLAKRRIVFETIQNRI